MQGTYSRKHSPCVVYIVASNEFIKKRRQFHVSKIRISLLIKIPQK